MSTSTAKILSPVDIATQLTPYVSNANSLKEQATRAVIDSAEKFNNATDFVKICNSNLANQEEARKKLVGPLNLHVKWINNQFKPTKDTIEEAKKIMSSKAIKWKQQEEARLRAEAEAERKEAEEQAMKEAEEAQKKGETDRAEALLSAAASTPEPSYKVSPGRGSLTGATGSGTSRWVGEVVDPRATCKAIAEGRLPVSLIGSWSQSALNLHAKATQKEGTIDGISVQKKESLVVR